MATMGAALTTPESGWIRIEDTHPRITYNGSFNFETGASWDTNGTAKYCATAGSTVKFSVYTSNLRIIGGMSNDGRTTDTVVYIDGVNAGVINQVRAAGGLGMTLNFEKTGMTKAWHDVIIVVGPLGGNFTFDAIDIDSDGYLPAYIGQVLSAPQVGWKRIDDTAPGITYTGTWTKITGTGYDYAGTDCYSSVQGDTVEFKFYGTKLRVIGGLNTNRSMNSQVWIDGKNVGIINEYNTTAGGTSQTVNFEITGLSLDFHTVKLVVGSGGQLLVDAFDIDSTGYMLGNVGTRLATPDTGWQRFDMVSGSDRFVRSGSWSYLPDAPNYGGGVWYTADPNGKVSFSFKGTKVRFLVNRYNNKPTNVPVKIDGVDAGTFSCYSTGAEYIVLGFEMTGLSDGIHTISVQTPVGMSPSLNWTLDAIDIDSEGYMVTQVGSTLTTPDTDWQRFDNTHPYVTYSGTWIANTAAGYYSGGNKVSNTVGSYFSFKFYGTKLRLISDMGTAGLTNATIEIDGVAVPEKYLTVGGAIFQVLLYEKTGLTPGVHTVKVTIPANVSPAGGYMGLDALDIDSDGYMVPMSGSILLTPETGWLRVDNTHAGLLYSGAWISQSNVAWSGGSAVLNNNAGGTGALGTEKVTFKFYGTKLRFIGATQNPNYNDAIKITIDGVSETFSQVGSQVAACLNYEKTGLPLGVHTVEVSGNNQAGKAWYVDAIDIDGFGYVLSRVGQVLINPEPYWQRVDQTNPKIKYVGVSETKTDTAWGGSFSQTRGVPWTITFGFYGTRFRLLGMNYSTGLSAPRVTIDGGTPEMVALAGPGINTNQVIYYEKTGLSLGFHTVVLDNVPDTSQWYTLDAIDIDDTGYLATTQRGMPLPTPDTGWQRIDETSTGLVFDPSWASYSTGTGNSSFWGNSEKYTKTNGATVKFKFYGTKFRLVANRFTNSPDFGGDVQVTIDGAVVGTYTQKPTSGTGYEIIVLLYEKTGLPLGSHTVVLTAVLTGTEQMTFDALDIDSTGYLLAAIGARLPAPETGWTRYDNTDAHISYTGTWTTETNGGDYGGTATYTATSGATVNFSFSGTALRLIGGYYAGRATNILIYIDGVLAGTTSEDFTNAGMTQALIFEKTGLSPGSHTVQIKTQDTKQFIFDALEINDTGFLTWYPGKVISTPESTWQRIDDNHPAIQYNGSGWAPVTGDANTYNGTAHYITLASTVTNTVNFKFYGTKMRIIDLWYTNRVNNVSITVDGFPYTYNPQNAQNTYRTMVFELTGLARGVHTVSMSTISTSGTFSIDAIDIDGDGYMMTPVGSVLMAPEPGWKRFEETDSILVSAGWSSASNPGFSGGKSIYSNTDGVSLTFKFYGTKVRIMGNRDTAVSATSPIDIDGVPYTYNGNSTTQQLSCLLFELTGLTLGIHTVTMTKPAGAQFSITLDAIDIDSTGFLVGIPQVYLPLPEPGWNRYDDKDSRLKFSANWLNDTSAGSLYNATGTYTQTGSATVSFRFFGTKLRVISYVGPTRAPLVNVTIDGVADSYVPRSSMDRGAKVVAYEKVGLAAGFHTVTMNAPGAALNAYFDIDAIDTDGYLSYSVGDVVSVTPDITWKRSGALSPAISYVATSGRSWGNQAAATSGVIAWVPGRDDRVEFDFIGTRFRVITTIGNNRSDIIEVKVDGVVVGTLSQYSATAIDKVLWCEYTGLTNVRHKVVLTSKTTNAITTAITIDAIDIDDTGRLMHPDEVLDGRDLVPGKRIRCHYIQGISSRVGAFSGLGEETKDWIPATPPTTWAPGDFYFICVDSDQYPSKRKLIADRNLQASISWDAINNVGLATGYMLTYDMKVKGLMSYFKFEETGLAYYDQAQSSNAGTGVGTVSIPGVSGNAVRFANNAYMTFDNALIPLGAKSLRFKIRVPAVPTVAVYPFANLNDSTSQQGFLSKIDTAGRLSMASCNASSTNRFGVGTVNSICDNQWHTVALTWDGTTGINTAKLYVDDMVNPVSVATAVSVESVGYAMAMSFGRLPAGTIYTTFDLDELEIFDTVINPAQPLPPNTSLNSLLRLPTAGISATDTANEWDRYISVSTLGGITPTGHNAIWNWSSATSWGNTSSTANTAQRATRGYTSQSAWGAQATTLTAATLGYRPLLNLDVLWAPSYKFLIEDTGQIKTYSNAAWNVLGPAPANESMFQNNGMSKSDLAALGDSVLRQLTSGSPKLIYYTDDPDVKTATKRTTAVPKPRVILPTGDIDISNVGAINAISVVGTTNGGGKVRVLASVDKGLTWKAYDGVNWNTVSITDMVAIATTVMTPTFTSSLGAAAWSALRGDSDTLRLAYYLEQSASTDTANVDTTVTNTDLKGTWRIAQIGLHYDAEFVKNNTIRMYLYANGSYKVNY